MARPSPLRTGTQLLVPDALDPATLAIPSALETTPATEADRATQNPFERGFRSAALGMSAGDTAKQSLEAELQGQATQASALRQQALEQSVMAQQVAPAINSYTQVHGAGDALDFAAGAVGQALPTMAPSIAGALLLRGSPAGLLGRRAASGALSYAGAYVPAYLQERNEAVLNQAQDPVAMQHSAQERLDTARLKGGANAALEALVPASLGHGFLRPGSALRTIGNSVVEEGLTEGIQEKVGQLAQSHLNPNRDTSQDNQNIIDASLQGAIGGGGISTPTALSQVGANALEASANKAVELGKAGGKKVLEAGQAVSDKTQLPERTNDMMDKLFRAADSVDLDKLKKGVMDPMLAKGKDLATTMQNMDLREKELPEIAKRVFESIKKKAPEWAAKVDPNNPDSLITAAKNADWSEKLKTFKRDIGEGFAAGKQFAVDRASKKNLMELDPQMQGDLQQLLFQHLNPDLQDVQSVRDAIPSVATRLAALSARVGDLDKHDVEAMTDLSDTFRSMFPDSEGLASKIKQYVKNTDTSLLDKILSIESATSDARKPGSFLELNLSEKARKAGWDMGQVGKYVDKAVADPDNANYGVLRNLFGSTAKANQVLDYYQSKMAEQGIELDQPEERPLDMSRNGITQVDLGDDTPQYLFADARTMRPFSATAKATVGRGKAQYETSHARKRLADVLNLARKQGNKDLEDSRAHVIGYGEYVAEQGGDPMEHVAQRLEAAQKKRADAETKGKKLKAAGADETELQAEREKIMDANREIKFLKTPGMEPQEILNELYKVVKLTKAKGPQATIDAMRARGMGLDRLVDDEEVHSMGTVLRQRPESEAARNAINATRVTFRTPEGKPVTLSAESIARVMMPRLQQSREGFAQKYQRAFAEGVAALQDQRGWVPEGDLKNVLVHRQGKVKAAGGITNAKDLEPNNSKVAAAARRAEFGVSDHKFATVANARKIEREHAGRPVELFDVAARSYDTVEAELKEAQAELTRARSEFAHKAASKKVARLINRLTSAREVAQNAAAKIYPMPERPVTTGIGKDELGDSGLTRLEEMRQDYMDALREYHDNLVELAGDSAVLDFDIARAEDRLNEERRRPEPKQFERDEGEDGQLEGIGRTEPGMGSRTTAIRSNKQRFEAQKKSSPQRAARERAKAEAAPKIEREPKEIPPPMKGGDGPRPDAVKVRGPHESKLPPDNMADVTKDIVPVISPKFGLPAKNLLDTKTTKFNMQAAELHRQLGREGFAASHDSPHRFDGVFNWREHALKGEGAMVFGAGTYLSTSEGVHKSYKQRFTAESNGGDTLLERMTDADQRVKTADQAVEDAEMDVYEIHAEAQGAHDFGDIEYEKELEKQMEAAEEKKKKAIAAADRIRSEVMAELRAKHPNVAEHHDEIKGRGPSPTYQVSVRATDDEIMDWDKPLSEQPKGVQEKLKQFKATRSKPLEWDREDGDIFSIDDGVAEYRFDVQKGALYRDGEYMGGYRSGDEAKEAANADAGYLTGANLYQKLSDEKGSDRAASDYLQSLGLVGHRYAANGGRNDTHPNYVIYDDVGRITTNAVSFNSQTGGAQGNTLNAQEQAALIADLQKQRGPDLKVVFDDFFKVGGSGSYTYDPATGERVIKIALQAMNPSAVGWHEALHDFFQMLGGDKSSTKMRKEIEAVTSSQPVIRQLRTLLKDHPAALEQIETSAEERAAYAYQFFLQGQIRLGPDTKTLFGKIHAFLARVLHTISTGARVEMALAALYQGHLADPSVASQVMAAIQAQNPTYADRMQAVSNMLGNVSEKLFGSTIERLDNTNVKALGEVGEAFYQPPDKQQDKSLPFLPRRSMARGVWANKVFKILEQYSHDELKAALANLQGMDRTGAIESQVGKLLDDMYDYQVVAGVKRLVRKQDPKTNEWETIEEPLKAIDNYFPRVWDLDSIRKNPQALIDALVQHGGQTQLEAGRIAQALMTHDTVGKTGIDTADTSYVPFNQSTLNREFDFINQSNAKHFAQFQSQDLGDILNTYVDQAVHRAEYARQFGNQGQWLEGKLKEAEAQGATPADLKMARAAIKGMEGTLGLDMSPELRRLQSGIITAENLILLPLALFSQVVDAVAIGARANSFKESLHALDRGFREVVKSFTKHADEFSKDDRLAMDLGIIDETAMLEAMGMTYQGMYMTKRLRNINRKFFRINRMEQWNRAMRVQGMVTGQRFILANKDNPRYMEELGLKASDIQETANGDLAVTELDGLTAAQARKMRTALFKFVDSAVLRPNAAHRPIWGNDPRFMLLIHLKQFSFSFQNVILKNMKKELAFGNAKPAMVLLGAIPLIMMSDLLKNASTGNLDANLTFGQALAHGVARSGLLGTRAFYSDAASDLTHGHMPGVSFLGPTFEHALTITQGILGVPGTDVADVVTRSVPGGALIRNFTQ